MLFRSFAAVTQATNAAGYVALVAIDDLLQFEAVIADVGDVEQGVFRKCLLHVEVVVLNVTVAETF